MADKPKATTTRLRITACTSTYTGKNVRGDEYTIYEVQALKSTGEVVGEKLTSFENLPLEVLDLTVTKFESEKYGVSYTLARKNKPNTAALIESLTEKVEDLLGRVTRLEQGTTQDAPQEAQPTAAQSDLDARFGAAPPF